AAGRRSGRRTDPTRTTSHPDFHRRYRNSTGSTSRWLRPGRGLSPPVRAFTDPGARVRTFANKCATRGYSATRPGSGHRGGAVRAQPTGADRSAGRREGGEAPRGGGRLVPGGPFRQLPQLVHGRRRVLLPVDRGP